MGQTEVFVPVSLLHKFNLLYSIQFNCFIPDSTASYTYIQVVHNNIADLVQFKSMVLMYKIYNNLMPSNILSYFCMVHMSHDHDTRQAGHFKNMYCRTTLKSMCLSVRGPVTWNKLHTDLKNSTSVNMFKKRYKTFLVSEYAVT